jgi:YggT family protein
LDLIVNVFLIIALVIRYATIAIAALFFLRVILTWLGVNPFGRIPYHLTRLTEPAVRPLRHQLGGRMMRYDLVPLMVGVLILVTGLFVASMIGLLAEVIGAIGKNIANGAFATRAMLGEFVKLLGYLYVTALFLRVFLPYFGVNYRNRFFHFLFVITEPLLKPLRRFFVIGMFDFSPIIAMFIVQLLTPVLASAVAG